VQDRCSLDRGPQPGGQRDIVASPGRRPGAPPADGKFPVGRQDHRDGTLRARDKFAPSSPSTILFQSSRSRFHRCNLLRGRRENRSRAHLTEKFATSSCRGINRPDEARLVAICNGRALSRTRQMLEHRMRRHRSIVQDRCSLDRGPQPGGQRDILASPGRRPGAPGSFSVTKSVQIASIPNRCNGRQGNQTDRVLVAFPRSIDRHLSAGIPLSHPPSRRIGSITRSRHRRRTLNARRNTKHTTPNTSVVLVLAHPGPVLLWC